MGMRNSHFSKSDPAACRVFQKLFTSMVAAKWWKRLEMDRAAQRGRGRKPELKIKELMGSLVYHGMMESGSLEQHVEELTGKRLRGASLSQWRQGLPWPLFEKVAAHVLKPLAHRGKHPQAFYRGLRLLALDGTGMSANNVPRILKRWLKNSSRRFKAAFAKVRMVLLVEVGLHNPVGVSIGSRQESEYALGWDVAQKLPGGSLVMGDRLYGMPEFVGGMLARCLDVGSHFLVRVRKNLTMRVIEKLEDDSAIVEIKIRAPEEKSGWFRFWVREIRGVVRDRSGKRISIRLWTSLRSARKYPAKELLALYFQRWEIETTVREMKITVYGGERLRSQTVETACQEILALVLAMSLLARARSQAAACSQSAPLCISFRQTLRYVRALWLTLSALGHRFTDRQIPGVINDFIRKMSRCHSPPRRNRSCPRAVRQPVSSWKRLIRRTEKHGEFSYEIKPLRS
jgi:hypothetical protein